MSILHICFLDKFIPPYIDFVRENFNIKEHKFILYGDSSKYQFVPSDEVFFINDLGGNLLRIVKDILAADKVIIHGLFDFRIIKLLFFLPWLLKKCCWVIWGGDLYQRIYVEHDWRWRKKEVIKKFVIRKIGYLITYIKGDYELAREWYAAKGKYIECLMYTSNIIKEHKFAPINNKSTIVLIGNSADPSNNHIEVFDRLLNSNCQNFEVYCPLSYGDLDYAKFVITKGEKMFPGRFYPINRFLKPEEYMLLLRRVDVAIFAHKRQQAMGSAIALLGMGKKLYIRDDVAQWEFYKDIGVRVYNYCDTEIDLEPLDYNNMNDNISVVTEYFSKERLVDQWKNIFSIR